MNICPGTNFARRHSQPLKNCTVTILLLTDWMEPSTLARKIGSVEDIWTTEETVLAVVVKLFPETAAAAGGEGDFCLIFGGGCWKCFCK